jgi:hypothetical protein
MGTNAGTVWKLITTRRKTKSVQPRRAKNTLVPSFTSSFGLRKEKISALGTLRKVQL